MKRIAIALVMIVASGVAAACSGKKPPPAIPAVETPKDVVGAAKATVEKWRLAYEGRSLDALSAIYTHDVELVVVQEGVALLGWSSVEAAIKDRLARAELIKVRLKDTQVTSLGADVASVVTTMTRELVSGSTTITESGTLSLIIRKVGETWLIFLEHYSYKRT